jgi:hypothetical protein
MLVFSARSNSESLGSVKTFKFFGSAGYRRQESGEIPFKVVVCTTLSVWYLSLSKEGKR